MMMNSWKEQAELKRLQQENYNLKKSIDKASKKLHWYDKRLGDENKTWTEQEWKEWLIKNE